MAWLGKRAIQVIPFLAALGITAAAATGTAGLTAFLAVCHHFPQNPFEFPTGSPDYP